MNGTAANLAEWGREEGIITVIDQGSKGLGYMLGDMLPIEEVAPGVLSTEEDKKAVAAYVMAEICEDKKTRYPDLVENGKIQYEAATCNACHGKNDKERGGMAYV